MSTPETAPEVATSAKKQPFVPRCAFLAKKPSRPDQSGDNSQLRGDQKLLLSKKLPTSRDESVSGVSPTVRRASASTTSARSSLSVSTTSARSSLSVSTTTTTSSSLGGSTAKKSKKGVSYLVYDKLVGEADGGQQLPPDQLKDLVQKYHDSWSDRISVRWRPKSNPAKECIRVKPNCLCFCGHAFKSHEWYDKQLRCRVPGCRCEHYDYLPKQGSWVLTCTCKHSAQDHGGHRDGSCCAATTGGGGGKQDTACPCPMFKASYTCQCGASWRDHETVAETASEKNAHGQLSDADIVAQRTKTFKLRSIDGKKCSCMGCKNLMPCRLGKKYNKNETVGELHENPYAMRKKKLAEQAQANAAEK